MSEKTRGRLYVAVCIACITTCLVLIASIFFQNKANQAQRTMIHQPRMDLARMEGEGGLQGVEDVLITEEYAAQMITQYLPENLPVTDLRVAISGNGLVAVAATADKEKFQEYLQQNGVDIGFKGSMLMALLPKQTPLVVAFSCQGGETGVLQLVPAALQINGADVDLNFIPQNFCDTISQAVNQVLAQTGASYSQISFRNGAFALLP